MSQHQFGLWSAIAIQDTSSVVAAAASYGNTALKIATTVKLERALWIIPVSLLCLVLLKRENRGAHNQLSDSQPQQKRKIRIPWFIFLFLIVMVLASYLPVMHEIGKRVLPISKKLLSLTLFFIGTGFSREAIHKVGIRPLILAVIIWCFIGTLSLIFLLHHA